MKTEATSELAEEAAVLDEEEKGEHEEGAEEEVEVEEAGEVKKKVKAT